MRYYLNYCSGQPQSFRYPYAGGKEILTGAPVRGGNPPGLPPWDLAVAPGQRQAPRSRVRK